MSESTVSRREFLRAGAVAGVAATAIPALAGDEEPAEKKEEAVQLVPKRKLGKSGIEVSILNQGTVAQPTARHLNVVYTEGIRYIDTSVSYGGGNCEKIIGEWFQKTGHRSEYFLATKDYPKAPEQWVEMLDKRLEALQTDYVDLYFIHGLSDREFEGKSSSDWPKDKEWAAAADKIRKSGKAKLVGFSTHCSPIELRTRLLNAAAEGGWVDAVMPAVGLSLIRENKSFNEALDNCHKAGVGLIAMKSCKDVGAIEKVFPTFQQKGLSKFTAVLTAMWTDERFASVCSAMDNLEKLRENAAAARAFVPLTDAELAEVHEMFRGIDRVYCAACDGSCRRAAGTEADLNTIARYVSYVEENGRLKDARELFAALPPEARDWSGADLAAASRACRCGLNFPRILAKAEQMLA